jgi:Thioredoxin
MRWSAKESPSGSPGTLRREHGWVYETLASSCDLLYVAKWNLKANTCRKRIARNWRSGEESGVECTPWLFINGFIYDGEPTVETLSAAIDRALATSAV